MSEYHVFFIFTDYKSLLNTQKMKKLIFNLLLINVLVINIANAQSVLLSENFDKLTAGAGQQLPIDWVARNANKDFAIWDIIANNPNNTKNAYSAPNAGVMSFGINGNDDYLNIVYDC